MCPALTDDHFLDLRTANRTSRAFPIIHPKIILELTAAICPINGCAVATDAGLQHLADRLMQRLSLLRGDRIRCRNWMQFCDVQGFIRIDVAQPGEEGLIEEQWFELAFFIMKRGVQPLRRKFLAEGFWTQPAEHFVSISS